MMKIVLSFLSVLMLLTAAEAGTMIYKNRDGEEKIVSQVKILSIDGRILVFSLNGGTETMPTASLLKYYDTDIRTAAQFDDSTADYDVSLGDTKYPELVKSQSGKSGGPVFTVAYDVTRKAGGPTAGALRTPYFYLFVLTTNDEGSRNLHSYAFPDKAKTSMKRYDEAKMLEKVIDLDRPIFHDDDGRKLGKPLGGGGNRGLGGGKTATFQLTGIKDARIIGWYLIVWNKSDIVVTKQWQDHSYKVGNYWWYY